MIANILLLHAAFVAPAALPAQTTLPVIFPHTISASRVHTGQAIEAKTTAPVRLSSGEVIPKGAKVTGHVVDSSAFAFDSTPYAQQKAGVLAIQFDSINDRGQSIPLHMAVRAMADPLASWDTEKPQATDLDSSHTTTQVGGDQVTPWIKEVSSSSGDTVGYMHGGFVYAHLLSSGGCDASTTEQAMGVFSASACGLYGMPQDQMNTKASGETVTLVLSSTHHSPQIHANSQALLEETSPTLETAAGQ